MDDIIDSWVAEQAARAPRLTEEALRFGSRRRTELIRLPFLVSGRCPERQFVPVPCLSDPDAVRGRVGDQLANRGDAYRLRACLRAHRLAPDLMTPASCITTSGRARPKSIRTTP